MLVTKRDGSTEPLDLEKIHQVLTWACNGDTKSGWKPIRGVSVSQIEMSAQPHFFNKIKTSDIHTTVIRAAANLISEDTPNYDRVAARLRIQDVRKKAFQSNTPPHLLEVVKANIKRGVYDQDLLGYYTEVEWGLIDSFIDHNRDDLFHFAGAEQMTFKYLVQNRKTKKLYETFQHPYILVAAILFKDYSKDTRLSFVKRYYDQVSQHYISLPTPIMAGLRTKVRQFSSCTLVDSGDSLKSITAAATAIVNYASNKAGIGLNIGRIRAEGQPVRGGDAVTTGVIPFARFFASALKSCSQGAIRGASSTFNYPIFHLEFNNLIELKNNKGTSETRLPIVDYCVHLNKTMYERLLSKGNITFFSPDEVPDLYEAFYGPADLFKPLYEKYEADPKKTKKVMPAEEVFTKLVQERFGTGRIYIFNADHVNTHSSINEKIYMTNLCFAGNTLVAVADGRNAVTIEELASSKNTFEVFSAVASQSPTRGHKLGGIVKGSEWKTVIRKAKAVATGEQELLRIFLSNGEYFDVTPTHELATIQYGKWVEAQNSIGCFIEPFGTFKNEIKYRCINSITSSKQHRMIYTYHKGEIPDKYHCDHINRDLGDNIDNLQVLTAEEHFRKTAEEVTGSGNVVHRIDKISQCKAASKSSFLTGNSRWLGMSDEDIISIGKTFITKNVYSFKALMREVKKLGGPVSLSKNRFGSYIEAGFNTRNDFIKACIFEEGKYIPTINYTEGITFKKDSKDKIHNWLYSPVEGGYTWTGLQVTKIEKLEKTKVYDITILDDNLEYNEQNFYIITSGSDNYLNSKGVLVHNCVEITQHTTPTGDENSLIALCTLSALNWGKIQSEAEMAEAAEMANRGLDALLDYQNYPNEAAQRHTELYRPLGVGIIGLAHDMVKNNLSWSNRESHAAIEDKMETMAFYLTKTSIELAKEKGSCPRPTKYHRGIFPMDTATGGTSPKHDWEPLKQDAIKYGIRNSTLMAMMPSETSSQLANETNGVQPPRALVTTKGNKDNVTSQVVPEYAKYNHAYELEWDVPIPDYFEVMARIQKYTDQSISVNESYSPKNGQVTVKTLLHNLLTFYKLGGKCLYYSNTNTDSVEESDDCESGACKI